MRRIAFVAALAAVATVVVVGATTSAWACSCVDATDQQHFDSADAVFTGTAVDRRDDGQNKASSSHEIFTTFDVQSAQKGKVPDPVVVHAEESGSLCGIVFDVGHRYQVFAFAAGEDWSTNSCSGTRDLGVDPAFTPKPKPKPSVPATPSVVTRASSPAPTPAPASVAPAHPSPTASGTPFGLIGPPLVADPNRGKPAAGVLAGLAALGALAIFVRTLRGRAGPSGKA